jgi:hypothetical protein
MLKFPPPAGICRTPAQRLAHRTDQGSEHFKTQINVFSSYFKTATLGSTKRNHIDEILGFLQNAVSETLWDN